MSIYLVENIGDTFWNESDSECYTYVGLTIDQPPTEEFTEEDTIHSGVTFYFDNTDPYKSSWTPCQVCVSQNYSGLEGTYEITASDVEGEGSYPCIYTAPADGEGRFFWHTNPGTNVGLYYTPNEDAYFSNISSDDQWTGNLRGGKGCRMAAGDSVYLGGRGGGGLLIRDALVGGVVQANFLPDSHSPGNDYSGISSS